MKSLLRTYSKTIQNFQFIADFILTFSSYKLILSSNLYELSFFEFFIVFLIILPVLKYSGLYQSYRLKSLLDLFIRILFVSFIIVFSIYFSNRFLFNDLLFGINLYQKFFISTSFFLLFNHLVVRYYLRYLRSLGKNSRSYLFWGEANVMKTIIKEINKNQYLGYKLEAWFSPEYKKLSKNKDFLPECKGGLEELRSWLNKNENSIDCIFFDSGSKQKSNLNQLLEIFGNTSLPVIFVPSWASINMKFNVGFLGNQLCLELWGNDQDKTQQIIKEIFDFLVSLFLIIILTPVFLVIAILIKFSSKGPIIFTQFRYGLNGKKFKIYKFRTMKVVENGLESNLKQATKNDKRITKLGKYLRTWSLDELPQLFNVVKGEMSIVGPRPHAVSHNEIYRKLITGYMQRHSFKPGISGLAQVEGSRGETKSLKEMEERISLDLTYQKNWSLRMDLKILLKTILKIKSKKAY